MSYSTFKGFKKCLVCNGSGIRIHSVTLKERNCEACGGYGKVNEMEAVTGFMTRTTKDVKRILPTEEDLTNLVYALNTKIRKEPNKDKKYRLNIIREEMMKLKSELF